MTHLYALCTKSKEPTLAKVLQWETLENNGCCQQDMHIAHTEIVHSTFTNSLESIRDRSNNV